MEHFTFINTALIGGLCIVGIILSIAFKWGIHGCEERLDRIEKLLEISEEATTPTTEG